MRPKRSIGSAFRRLGCGEKLESREMLSGHGLSSAFSYALAEIGSHLANTAAVSHLTSATSTTSVMHQNSATSQTVLTAQLTDSSGSATGSVFYSTGTVNGTTETLFKVSVTGAAADTTLDVSVGGTIVGQITTDANGAGTLVLSSNPDGSNEQSLPANFPTSVTTGTAVTVGTLSGSLATPTQTGTGCGQHAGTTLTSALADPNSSSATGTATYYTSTVDGSTVTKLKVSVTGAAASSTLDVSVDGTVVGQITTDTSGAGSLVLSSNPHGSEQQLPSNFPTSIAAGSTVTVGTLTGTLSSPSGESSNSGHFQSLFRRR